MTMFTRILAAFTFGMAIVAAPAMAAMPNGTYMNGSYINGTADNGALRVIGIELPR